MWDEELGYGVVMIESKRYCRYK